MAEGISFFVNAALVCSGAVLFVVFFMSALLLATWAILWVHNFLFPNAKE